MGGASRFDLFDSETRIMFVASGITYVYLFPESGFTFGEPGGGKINEYTGRMVLRYLKRGNDNEIKSDIMYVH